MQAGASAYICKPLHPPELLGQLCAFLQLADVKSARAKAAAERAAAEELARHRSRLSVDADGVGRAALLYVERLCRSRAFTAYADKGGTRASFERDWKALFAELARELERAHVHAIE